MKVFLCVLGIITERSHSQKSPSSNADQRSYFSERFTSSPPALRSEGFTGREVTPNSFHRMMENLNFVINDIPSILLFVPSPSSSTVTTRVGESRTRQFDIMKVNIHITKLFLQSVILERCSTILRTAGGCDETLYTASDDLWKSREGICRQLLEILNFCPEETLESHGTSMVVKIRGQFSEDRHLYFCSTESRASPIRHDKCLKMFTRRNILGHLPVASLS